MRFRSPASSFRDCSKRWIGLSLLGLPVREDMVNHTANVPLLEEECFGAYEKCDPSLLLRIDLAVLIPQACVQRIFGAN